MKKIEWLQFVVDLWGFDGTKLNCYDDDVEARHGVDQQEHSLYKHEHSFDQHDHAQDHKEHSLEPARAYTGKWLMCALKLMHLTRKGSRYCCFVRASSCFVCANSCCNE